MSELSDRYGGRFVAVVGSLLDDGVVTAEALRQSMGLGNAGQVYNIRNHGTVPSGGAVLALLNDATLPARAREALAGLSSGGRGVSGAGDLVAGLPHGQRNGGVVGETEPDVQAAVVLLVKHAGHLVEAQLQFRDAVAGAKIVGGTEERRRLTQAHSDLRWLLRTMGELLGGLGVLADAEVERLTSGRAPAPGSAPGTPGSFGSVESGVDGVPGAGVAGRIGGAG